MSFSVNKPIGGRIKLEVIADYSGNYKIGKVNQLGEEKYGLDGKVIPFQVAVGDLVLYDSTKAIPLVGDRSDCVIVDEPDIEAIMREP